MPEAFITGVGRTACGRLSQNAIELQAEAALRALESAGLRVQDVDALISMPSRTMGNRAEIGLLCAALGIRPDIQFSLESGGVSAIAQVNLARSLVSTGQAANVLCVGGQNFLSAENADSIRAQMLEHGPLHPVAEFPYDLTIPAIYALLAQRWLSEGGSNAAYGLSLIAAQIRTNAAGKPLARFQGVVTEEDVETSRLVSDPLHLLECASLADGAAAIVVSNESSPDSVEIAGIGFAADHSYTVETQWEHRATVARAGERAMSEAHIKLVDIDFLQLYDSFSIAVAIQLEGLGYCGIGEAGVLARDRGFGPKDSLPVCTHGGLLANGQPGIAGAMFHVVEAVQQLRGQCAESQIPRAAVGLVTGASGLLSQVGALVLRRN